LEFQTLKRNNPPDLAGCFVLGSFNEGLVEPTGKRLTDFIGNYDFIGVGFVGGFCLYDFPLNNFSFGALGF
jgi:hypothetical protein